MTEAHERNRSSLMNQSDGRDQLSPRRKTEVVKKSIGDNHLNRGGKVVDSSSSKPLEDVKDKFKLIADNSYEIDWFSFESRIRSIVSEQVIPIQKESRKNIDIVRKADDAIELANRRLEEMTVFIQKSAK